MISLVIFLVFVAVAVSVLFKHKPFVSDGRGNKTIVLTALGVPVGLLVLGLLAAFIQPFTLERVDAGFVGIKVNLTGDNRGVGKYEYKTGWVIINSWTEKLYEFPTFQQTIEYGEQQVITKGGFPATIHPRFNYTLNPGNIGDMFSNLRKPILEVEQGWLKNAIVGAVNDVANKWTVDDVFNNRERFEGDIVAEANKRVVKWFNVSQLRTNITPPEAIVNSINAKTKAIQEVQVAENQRLVAIAEAERKIAEARGDSAQAVIQAAGRAEAIKKEQLSLTGLYIDYIKVQKWDGVLPTVQGSNGIMLNMDKK
jgi:regulator of protease activity HflC (stomatin/prohibitin superfamily)